jgi:hypothetical protein
MTKRKREEQIKALMRERRPVGVAVSYYAPGTAPDRFTPGDFSVHRATTNKGRGGATTMLGKAIQAGERTRYGNSDFARWTHSTLVVSETGDICEAIDRGVALDNIEKYRGSDYMIVHVRALEVQRQLACAFARERVGDKYGILNFVGLIVQSLFGWNLSLHMDGQFICSGLVSRATEKYIDGYPRSPESMMPGDLAYYWDAESGEPEPAMNWWDRFLNSLVWFVDLFRATKGDPAPDPGHPSSPGSQHPPPADPEHPPPPSPERPPPPAT